MSATASTSSQPLAERLAASEAFRSFAIVFALASPILYTICEMANWPLFTYHPATNQIDLGWAPSVRDVGPAMHWYGWTASMLLGSAILGLIAARLPGLVRAIPLSLLWILPLLVQPVLIYGLRFYWRW